MLKKILIIVVLLMVSNISVMACCNKGYSVSYKSGIYHIIVDSSASNHYFKSILSDTLVSNKSVHLSNCPIFTMNTGFFDPKNQRTISYIVSGGTLLENPLDNENLVNNAFIMKNWDKISNRAEFRVLKQDNKIVYDITPHNTPYTGILLESAQAGPMLLPTMDLEKEMFIVKNSEGRVTRESASILHKTERTVIGLKNNEVHIFIITEKSPMTVYEVQNLCKSYNLDKAMMFDGGSSTSLDYLDKYHVVSTGIKGDNTGRRLKSFLIYK